MAIFFNCITKDSFSSSILLNFLLRDWACEIFIKFKQKNRIDPLLIFYFFFGEFQLLSKVCLPFKAILEIPLEQRNVLGRRTDGSSTCDLNKRIVRKELNVFGVSILPLNFGSC